VISLGAFFRRLFRTFISSGFANCGLPDFFSSSIRFFIYKRNPGAGSTPPHAKKKTCIGRLFSKNGRMPGGAGRWTSTSFEASSATGIPNLVR